MPIVSCRLIQLPQDSPELLSAGPAGPWDAAALTKQEASAGADALDGSSPAAGCDALIS